MMKDSWNPNQYNKFQSERSKPFWDLAGRVDFSKIRTMLDIGCGTGELTRSLHDKNCLVRTLGVDSSAKMLTEAARFAKEGVSFEQADALTYVAPGKFDLVLSNAALQWVPDHQVFFTKMSEWISPDGFLAVQMPVNFDHPSHLLADEVALKFGIEPRKPPLLRPEEYAQLLWKLGLKDVNVDVHVYLHPLESAAEVVEWTKGTLLTHFQNQLPADRFAEFVRTYTYEFTRTAASRRYLYTFKRLFVVARQS